MSIYKYILYVHIRTQDSIANKIIGTLRMFCRTRMIHFPYSKRKKDFYNFYSVFKGKPIFSITLNLRCSSKSHHSLSSQVSRMRGCFSSGIKYSAPNKNNVHPIKVGWRYFCVMSFYLFVFCISSSVMRIVAGSSSDHGRRRM